MDIVQTVTFALYIPVALLFGLCSIFFIRAGYKKGFWRSLISLIATVVAVIVSLLLGKLFGQQLAGPLATELVNAIPTGSGIPLQMMASVIQSVIQAVLTFALFGMFVIITLILFKAFSRKIHFSQMDNEPADEKGLRVAGMGLRCLDAVIVTLVLLIPLYGPLSVTLPVASGLVGVVADESDDAVQAVKAMEQHPVLRVYKAGPVSVVSESLSDVNIGGETIDTAHIMSVIEGVITRFETFDGADGQERADALAELVGYVRENVIEESWSYDLLQALRKEVNDPKYLQEEVTEEGLAVINALTDTDRETFVSNGIALLDFIEYALENGFMDFYNTSNYEALSTEFYEKLGALINHSRQAVFMKKLIYVDEVYEMFGSRESATAFIDHYIPDEPLPTELQMQESESFMRIFFTRENVDKLEALVRHPGISAGDVEPLMTAELLSEYMRYMEDGAVSQGIMNAAVGQLSSYETAPLLNYTFSNYLYMLSIFEQVLTGSDDYYRGFNASDALLQDIVSTVDDEFYCNSTLDSVRVKKLLAQALEEAKAQPGVWGFVDIVGAYSGEIGQVFNP